MENKDVQEAVARMRQGATEVDLNDKKIGVAGVKVIAQELGTNSTLKKLYLRVNNIGLEGAKALADALRKNKTLTILALHGNQISDVGANSLADALRVNTALQELYVGNNQISDVGANSLADALRLNTALTGLYLRNNQISDVGANSLADALRVNTALKELYLGGNPNMSVSVRDKVEALARSTRTAAPQPPQPTPQKPPSSSTVSVADLQRQLEAANQQLQQEKQRARQAEQAKQQAEQAKQQAEQRVQQAGQAKEQLEQRVADLEKQLPRFLLDQVLNQTIVASGSFKDVKRGQWRHTDVAVAVLKKANPSDKEQREFQHDIRTLTRLRHPNIVLLMAVTPPGHTPLAVMTEYMSGGSLYDYLERCRKFDVMMALASADVLSSTSLSSGTVLFQGRRMTERQKTHVLRCSTVGLIYMHDQGIAHRDVKSLNLLVSDDLTQVKWCDFGYARIRNEVSGTYTDAMVGSPKWMAPELIDHTQKSDGYAADRYALGIIVWEVITLEELYPKFGPFQIANAVLNQQLRPPLGDMSTKFRVVCEGLWKQNPSERMSLARALEEIDSW